MNTRYNAADIEVLSGLDPVKRRPGMYTDTARPNHLAQEVIDNAVDEALAGHARHIEVTLYKDGSCEVSDDGRGMPVDIHPEEKISGVELILTRLHAGGKFSDRNYTFSGGLHGVGVSVVNALSKHVELFIKREGNEYRMAFADGHAASKLEIVGSVGKKNTGTRLRFWPDPKYFDTPKFAVRALRHLLRAKAVLCPGLTVKLHDEATGEQDTWYFEDGLRDYLRGELAERELLPAELFVGSLKKDREIVDWAVAWVVEGELVQESYVNLIPTAQHGTHVNGLRSGLTDALREVLRFPQPAAARREAGAGRRVGPRGVRAVAEDDRPAVQRPDQGTPVLASGRRLHRGRRARCLQPVAEPERGDRHAHRADRHRPRQRAAEDREADRAQEGHPGSGAAGQAGRLHQPGPVAH